MTALRRILIIALLIILLSTGCLLGRRGDVPEPQPAPEDLDDIPSLPSDTTASPAPTLSPDKYCAEYVTGKYQLISAMPLNPDANCFELYRKNAPSSLGKQFCIYEDAKVLYVEAADSDVLCCMAYYEPFLCDPGSPGCEAPCEAGGFPEGLN